MKTISDGIQAIANYTIFQLYNESIALNTVFQLIVLLFSVYLTAKFIKFLCQRWLLKKLNFDVGNREAISTLVFYISITVGSLIAIQSTGINLSSLTFIIGGLGIGIGFGLQSITKDFMSGLILLIGRTIKINDFIQFGERQEFPDFKGTVKKISFLFTVVETKDSGFLIVPNSYLITFPTLNWSYGNQINRLKILLRVSKDIDFVLFTDIILNAAHREISVQKKPSPKLIFKEIGDYYCEFELQVWIKNIRNEDFTKNRLNYACEYYLKQQGIHLIFPTQYLATTQKNYDFNISINQSNDYLQKSNNIQDSHGHRIPLSIRDTLKRITYFANLNDLEIRQLIEAGYRERLEKETIIFNEGDPGDAFYIILSGSVEIFVPQINKYLVTLRTGNFFGELSLMLGIPRTASVKTIEKTLLFVITKEKFNFILQEQEELAEVIIQELGKHQEELKQRQEQLREMGLISEDEDDSNLMKWVRKRFNKLFSLSELL